MIIGQDITTLLPEIVLVLYAMISLLWGVVFTKKDSSEDSGALPLYVTSLVLFALAIWIALNPEDTRLAFNDTFTDDLLARFAKVTILLSAALIMLIGREFLEAHQMLKFEFPVLICFAVVGMMVMVSASDLMVLYVGVELQALSLYVLAAFHRDNSRSTEAGLKYFVLGALSSGLLLFGASFVYGYSGTTQFVGIAESLTNESSTGLLIGLIFILVGLAFKVSAAPFHMWVPDVYEGAPTPVTALFATAPKVAAIILLARLLFEAFGEALQHWQLILIIVSVASMFLGAIAAIGQQDIKRLMAYSSIAHMGYALMGLAAGTPEGVQSMLTYIAIYVVMNVGTFSFILLMKREGRYVTEITSLKLCAKQTPTHALSMLILLFSLAGIVPMVGFFAKLYVFLAVINADLLGLALAGAIASVIGAYYYLRIVHLMYFGDDDGERLDRPSGLVGQVIVTFTALIMVVGVINLLELTEMASRASQSLFN